MLRTLGCSSIKFDTPCKVNVPCLEKLRGVSPRFFLLWEFPKRISLPQNMETTCQSVVIKYRAVEFWLTPSYHLPYSRYSYRRRKFNKYYSIMQKKTRNFLLWDPLPICLFLKTRSLFWKSKKRRVAYLPPVPVHCCILMLNSGRYYLFVTLSSAITIVS